ncbi:MAG: thiamine-phosphate kinase [Verrucomicrobia bacterium]|nr:thiamine-phosphate kinase [Verrucomicrobiota bacterium]
MSPFTRKPAESVAAWGETQLIAAIRGWLGAVSPRAPFGIGDDCAVLPPSRGRQLVTVDPVIYGRHFDDSVPPREVGAKLLKRNLSDIAAMGGRPVAAVLAITLDGRTSRRWIELFYRGLAATARRYHVAIVGGDVAEGRNTVAASLTLLGEATGPRVLTRSGARLGDWIYVTGLLGRSRASGHHYRFSPRLEEGAWFARRPEVRAMMDVSDGLAKDLGALTPRGARPSIDTGVLPRRAGATVREALSDGEDYELLLAVNHRADRSRLEQAWRDRFSRTRLTCIGRFAPAGSRGQASFLLADYSGYEHFR